jgi:hypothetical protein
MIYIIGGAARAGKTIIARRMLVERNIPYFCVDYFVSALDQGAPELGIDAESPGVIKAPRLWPRIEPMLRNIVEVEPEYTIEGDALYPQGVSSLLQAYAGQIRACFLGYADTTPERKLNEIRAFAGNVNDWIQKHPDQYILDLAEEMIGFSRYVRDECNRYSIPYFDVSNDFDSIVEKAYRRLCGSE